MTTTTTAIPHVVPATVTSLCSTTAATITCSSPVPTCANQASQDPNVLGSGVSGSLIVEAGEVVVEEVDGAATSTDLTGWQVSAFNSNKHVKRESLTGNFLIIWNFVIDICIL